MEPVLNMPPSRFDKMIRVVKLHGGATEPAIEPPLPSEDDPKEYIHHLLKYFPKGPIDITVKEGIQSPISNPDDPDGTALAPIPAELLQHQLTKTLLDKSDFDSLDKAGNFSQMLGKKRWGLHRTDYLNAWKKVDATQRATAVQRVANNIAAAVMKAGMDRGTDAYPQFNLSDKLECSKYMAKEWIKNDPNGARGVERVAFHRLNQIHHSILCFCSSNGRTQGHVDWSSAVNTAVAVQYKDVELDLKEPLARWLFFHPCAIIFLGQWLRLKKRIDNEAGDFLRLSKWDMPVIKDSEVEEVKRFIQERLAELGVETDLDEGAGVEWVKVVDQYHGDWIQFPPGYLHQVITMQPCVKFAWDVYWEKELERYLVTSRDVICPLLGQEDLAEDYMNLHALTTEVLTEEGRSIDLLCALGFESVELQEGGNHRHRARAQ